MYNKKILIFFYNLIFENASIRDEMIELNYFSKINYHLAPLLQDKFIRDSKNQKAFFYFLEFISQYCSLEPHLELEETLFYYDLFEFYLYEIDENSEKHRVLEHILYYFYTLSIQIENDDSKNIYNVKFLERIVSLLSSDKEEIVTRSLIIINNITCNEESDIIDLFIDTHLIVLLESLIEEKKEIYLEDCLDIICNLVLEENQLKNLILDQEFFFCALISLLEENTNDTLIEKVLKVFRNLFFNKNINIGEFLQRNTFILREILKLLSPKIKLEIALYVNQIFKFCLDIGEYSLRQNLSQDNFVVEFVLEDETIQQKLWQIQNHDEDYVYKMYRLVLSDYGFNSDENI